MTAVHKSIRKQRRLLTKQHPTLLREEWGVVYAFVPRTGVEPACREAPPPQDGESTNFSTWAKDTCLK